MDDPSPKKDEGSPQQDGAPSKKGGGRPKWTTPLPKKTRGLPRKGESSPEKDGRRFPAAVSSPGSAQKRRAYCAVSLEMSGCSLGAALGSRNASTTPPRHKAMATSGTSGTRKKNLQTRAA
jgi:hypothetical protein